jgi:hypothetical protein
MKPYAADPEVFDPVVNPILREITTSFLSFKKSYLLRNNNFLNSEVKNNPLIFENLRTKIPVKPAFFTIWLLMMEFYARSKLAIFKILI